VLPPHLLGEGKVIVELNCKICGNNRFTFPADANEPVSCDSCGEVLGTYAEIQEEIAVEVVGPKQST